MLEQASVEEAVEAEATRQQLDYYRGSLKKYKQMHADALQNVRGLCDELEATRLSQGLTVERLHFEARERDIKIRTLEQQLESRSISSSISTMHESIRRKLTELPKTTDRNDTSVSPVESADKPSRDLMVEVWWNSPEGEADKLASRVRVSEFEANEARDSGSRLY